MKQQEKYYVGRELVVPQGGFTAVLMDFDDTITSPILQRGGLKGKKIYEVSRVAAAKTIGALYGNKYLTDLTDEQSEEAYLNAHEPTLEGSIAYLLHKAGIFSSSRDYDRAHPILQEFSDERNKLHKSLLPHISLQPRVVEFIKYASDTMPYGVAVASMAPFSDIKIVFDANGLFDLIPQERVVSINKVGRPKPDREVNDTAISTLGIADGRYDIRQKILGIDDSIGGIQSIHKAGATAVAITTNRTAEGFVGTPARFAFNKYAELLKVLRTAEAKENRNRVTIV